MSQESAAPSASSPDPGDAASASRVGAMVADYMTLTKPRVISLIVFCAFIGMLLVPGHGFPVLVVIAATVGIALVAGAAAAFNCLVEQHIDKQMARTKARPTARGVIGRDAALMWSAILCIAGLAMLVFWVNLLTAALTFATFVGYSIIYTLMLKPRTPQNIVIGGLSGAMPPALGWAAVANDVPAQAWLLVLIIYVWTPPHFWSLALYRTKDYAVVGIPMLPVTHGAEYTRLQVWLYSLLLCIVTLLPFVIGMSGWLYLVATCVLDGVFLLRAWEVWRNYSDAVGHRSFRYSILYLSLLFAALLADRYVGMMFQP